MGLGGLGEILHLCLRLLQVGAGGQGTPDDACDRKCCIKGVLVNSKL